MAKKLQKIYLTYYNRYILHINIDNERFIARSLSNLVSNLSEGINKIKCKYRRDDKKM